MGREDYLRALMEEIKDFPEEDREQIKEYFEEMICDRMEDGETEEEILEAIGSPKQAGMKLRSEFEARPDNGFHDDEDSQDEADTGWESRDFGWEHRYSGRGSDRGMQFSEKIMQASESAMQILDKIIQVPEKILSEMEGRYGQQGTASSWQQDEAYHGNQPGEACDNAGQDVTVAPEEASAEAKEVTADAKVPGVDAQEQGTEAEEASTDAKAPGVDAKAPGTDAKDPATDTQNSAYNGLQFIRVLAENTKIHVRTVKRDKVQVLFQPRDGVDEVWTSEEDGGFTFNHRMRQFWFFDVWELGRNKWITVEIPENFQGRVELVTKNAIIQAENLGGLESLHAETSNAKINVARVEAERIWLQTSNASVSVSEAAGQDLWVKSSNGHINLDDAAFTGMVDVHTSNGAVEVAGVSGSSITLHTSNGAVRGWLAGSIADYDIESRTSNASSTLPTNMHTGKSRKLKVRTSNGKININFAENS